MKQITLRGIPDEITKIIEREAEKKSISLNKAFILFLEKASGTKVKRKNQKIQHDEFNKFFGVWSKNESLEFDKNLEIQRKIDDNLWKEID